LKKNLRILLINNLDLIESELVFGGNQVNCYGKRVDILCEDRHGQTLIIEVKRIAIRKDIAQLLDYAGRLIKHHAVIIAAMKAKQNVDMKYAKKLKESIEELLPYYIENK
jgi:RecB family endonuclease NucS